jgi:hypothetical protein
MTVHSKQKPASANAVVIKKTNVLKRPAAGVPLKVTTSEHVRKMKQGIDEDPEDTDVRDKGKGEKFAKMRDKLPAHIIDLYDKEALTKDQPRSFRTKIINKLFVQKPNGKYDMNLTEPLFEEHKTMYSRKYGKDEEKAFPKSVLLGLYFQNSDVAFNKALDCGDIKMTKDGDTTFYAFRELTVGKEKGTTHCQGVTAKKKLDNNEYKVIVETLDSLNWSFELTAKEER